MPRDRWYTHGISYRTWDRDVCAAVVVVVLLCQHVVFLVTTGVAQRPAVPSVVRAPESDVPVVRRRVVHAYDVAIGFFGFLRHFKIPFTRLITSLSLRSRTLVSVLGL